MHDLELSNREISKSLDICLGTINYWVRRYKEVGNMDRKVGSGRPRITDARTDRHILITAKANRRCTIEEIMELAGVSHLSKQTVINRITETGEFGIYRLSRKPFISAKNLKARLKFANEHVNKPMEYWLKVFWSDESPFAIRYGGIGTVIRTRAEKLKSFACTGTVKHPPKINIWGGFSAHGVGHIHRIYGNMDQEMYRQILIHHARPSLETLFPDGDWIFQQDNDPKHKARSVQAYFRNNGWNVMEWPAQSPDLNPIENLWANLDRSLKKRQPKNVDELFDELKKGWEALPIDTLRKHVESMPNRCRMVIEAKGYPIDY